MAAIPTYRVVEVWDAGCRFFRVEAWEVGRLVRIVGDNLDQHSAYALRSRLTRELDALLGRAIPTSTELAYTGGRNLAGSRRGGWWR